MSLEIEIKTIGQESCKLSNGSVTEKRREESAKKHDMFRSRAPQTAVW